MAQMTNKEATDLFAYFTLISVSKQGNALIDKYITQEQIHKMMQLLVQVFEKDNRKAEAFIINELQQLLQKLDEHDLSDAKESTFRKVDV